MEIVVASILNFLVVVFILWYYGRRPAAEMFVQRSQSIENAMREAEKEFKDAQKELAEGESNWKSCEAHAKKQEDEALSGMARYREKVLRAAQAEADRLRSESKLVAQGEALRARQNLQREVASASIYSAQRFLQKQLDERDRHKLVSDYVELVKNGTAG